MNKQPQITERTKAVLCKAFWTLYSNHALSDISVRQITDIAGYNRGTFYLYYRDLPDMLHQIEEGLLVKLESLVASLTTQSEQSTIVDAFEQLLQFMSNQREYFTVLLGTHAEPQAYARCADTLWHIIQTYHTQAMPPAAEHIHDHTTASDSTNDNNHHSSEPLLKAFVTQGLLAVILQWMKQLDADTTATISTSTSAVVGVTSAATPDSIPSTHSATNDANAYDVSAPYHVLTAQELSTLMLREFIPAQLL